MTREELRKKELNGRNLNNNTWEFVRAAMELGFTYRFLSPEYYGMENCVEISDGRKSVRLMMATTPLNDQVAMVISANKNLARKILEDENLPVPKEMVVQSFHNPRLAEMKLPLVVKPIGLSGGQGITTNITDHLGVERAINFAQKTYEKATGYKDAPVIVQDHLVGTDYRILVLGDEVIAAVSRHAPTVIGNGQSSVKALIDAKNEALSQASRPSKPLKIDRDLVYALDKQGLTVDSIPSDGQTVTLHSVANFSSGGSSRNVTDTVHPGFKEIAIRASSVMGLVLCGLDIMAEDISRPPSDQVHGIVEVNHAPDSLVHLYPAVGEPIDAPKMMLQYMFS